MGSLVGDNGTIFGALTLFDESNAWREHRNGAIVQGNYLSIPLAVRLYLYKNMKAQVRLQLEFDRLLKPYPQCHGL